MRPNLGGEPFHGPQQVVNGRAGKIAAEVLYAQRLIALDGLDNLRRRAGEEAALTGCGAIGELY